MKYEKAELIAIYNSLIAQFENLSKLTKQLFMFYPIMLIDETSAKV